MNPVRIVIILVAGIAAIGLALFVRNLAASKPPPPPVVSAQAPAPPMTRVLVAKVDLSVGATLSAENMSWQPWPESTVNIAYVTDGVVSAPTAGAVGVVNKATTAVGDIATSGGPKMQAMVGAIVREPIYAGEPITSKKVVRSGDSSYMAVRLPEGMRALSLPLTTVSGAGGFIEPGDRIDVLSTHADTSKASNGTMITETVLANVLVLAVDQRTELPKGSGQQAQGGSGSTITLEVPVDSVEAVARAGGPSGGTLTMALRSYADIGGRTTGPTNSDTHTVHLFKGGGPADVVTTQ